MLEVRLLLMVVVVAVDSPVVLAATVAIAVEHFLEIPYDKYLHSI